MEKNNNISQVETILVDIRKAYRLLYSYQSKVLDLMKFIGYLTGRDYKGGWSKFSNYSPKDGKGSLDNWAWDWLNLYTYEFYFGEKIVDESKINFSVWLVSDSGFYDSDIKSPKEVDAFASIENSVTKLVFVIGKNTWHSFFKDFYNNLKKDATEYVRMDDKGTLLVKSIKLSSFLNADETRNRLQEVVTFCKQNGIPEFDLIRDNLPENAKN